jgi:hypothetical protein
MADTVEKVGSDFVVGVPCFGEELACGPHAGVTAGIGISLAILRRF